METKSRIEPAELIQHVAAGKWTPADVTSAMDYSSDEVRQVSVALMQQASQFSPHAAERKELNCPTAYEVRSRVFTFVDEVVEILRPENLEETDNKKLGRWWVRKAEYYRRMEESKKEGHLSFGDKIAQGLRDYPIQSPRPTAERILAEMATLEGLDRDTRMLLGYERSSWLQLDGKFTEASEMFHEMSEQALEAKDPLSAVIFNMQASKAALDGKLPNAADSLIVAQEAALQTLQKNRGEALAQQWMEKTMPAHLDQAIKLGTTFGADRMESLRDNMAAAREGRFGTPSIGGMA